MSSENGISKEQHINAWQNYRPVSSINFSDIVEDRTIYDQTRSDVTFDTNEISCRSTTISKYGADRDFDPDAVSVDDILRDSVVHEIRNMSLSRPQTLSTSIRGNTQFDHSSFPLCNDDISCTSADFRPAEEMQEQLIEDEKLWEQDYADIPQTNGCSTAKASTSKKCALKQPGKLANMTDFSLAYVGDCTISSNTDMSIGRYFQNRCEDLKEIISAKSPTKHVPIALVPKPNQSLQSTVYMENESNSNTLTTTPRVSSTTYDKEVSVLSLSSIASHLEDNDSETPKSFLERLYANKTKPATNIQKSMDVKKPQPKYSENDSHAKNKSDDRNHHPVSSNIILSSNSSPIENRSPKNQTSSKRSYQKVSPMTMDEIKDSRYAQKIIDEKQQQCDYAEKDLHDMHHRLNSTKIGEENNDRQDITVENNSADKNHHPISSNIILGSNCSPIKNRSPQNRTSNKRSHQKVSPMTKEEIIDSRYAQKENTENGNSTNSLHNIRSPRRNNVLDDVSSEMMNRLRIRSPERSMLSAAPIQKYATDMNYPVKAAENRSTNDQRHYARQRSPECPSKHSLPSYGLYGLRSPNQDAVSLDKRCSSQLSTHSEFTYYDGKFPLKSNKSELVWECVKLRKSVTKSVVIKNTSKKRLSLKVIVVGPGYQLASGTDAESIVLQGVECRTIAITFCPTVIGKAMGRVVFKPTKQWPDDTDRSVKLYGYGGSTVLQLQSVERGPIGSSYLKMGETNSITSTTLKRSFIIYNKGPLNGVATIFVKPKTNQYINESHILIEPNKCAIRPDGSAQISVTYKLRRKDLERLREKTCEVLTIGTLEVIFGSEPNRQRIASMLTRNGDIPSTYKQLEFLVNNFPVASIESFNDYLEDIENVADLFGCFKTAELALTINRTNLDETRENDLSDMDESVLFRTLVVSSKDTPSYQPIEEYSRSIQDNGKMWAIQPKRLLMDNRNNSRKSIVIKSFFQQSQTFQVDSEYRDFFNFSIKSGQIKPGDEYKIDIELKHQNIRSFSTVIAVYIETDCIEIPITVQTLPHY